MYTLNYHFKKLSVTPWLTAFQKSQVRYRLPESALLSCNEQTLFHLPSGLILIPKDSHTSVFKREGSSARIKDITLDMTHDKSSKRTLNDYLSISHQQQASREQLDYVRCNIKLKDHAHETHLHETLTMLKQLPDDCCVKPIMALKYTGKQGYQKLKLIMPKMENDLFVAIDLGFFDIRDELKKLAAQIVLILSHVEDLHHIYHRDIKPENFLYRRDEQGRLIIKLTDFEYARGPVDDEESCGSPRYLAPEMLPKRQQEEPTLSKDRADIWSAGVMLYAAATKEDFFHDNLQDWLEQVQTMAQGEIRYKLNQKTKGSLKSLLKQMIVRDVSKRPSFTDLLQARFITAGLKLLKREKHPILKLCPERVMPTKESTAA